MMRSLRSIITLPFAVTVICLGALTSYVGYYYGYESTMRLSLKLSTQIEDHIESELRHLLEEPHRILKINAERIGAGEVPAQDQKVLQRLFWRQVNASDSLTSLYFGNTEGGLACGGKEPLDGSTYIIGTRGFTSGIFDKFIVDSKGKVSDDLTASFPDYDARTRSWYKAAVKMNGPAWNDVYTLFTHHDLAISPSYPVKDQSGKLIGVMGGDLFLSHLSHILKNIAADESWTIFILDADGFLLGSSTDEPPFTTDKDGKLSGRLKGESSKLSLVRDSSIYIEEQLSGKVDKPERPQTINIDGVRHIIQYRLFRDEYGINWTIGTVVPEEALLEGIHKSSQIVVILVFIAILISMGIGYLVSRRMIRPITMLKEAANDLSKGKWGTELPRGRSVEVYELSLAFISMREQLKGMLEQNARHLEELGIAEERLRLAVDGANIAFWDFNPQTGEAFFSDRWMTMLGYAPDETEHSYAMWRSLLHEDDIESVDEILKQYLESGLPMSMEFRMRTQSGDYKHIHSSGMVFGRDAEGLPTRMSGIHQDITATKSLEEQLRHAQKMDAMGTLASGIAHDFNNLLAGILGYTELSLDSVSAESELKEYLEEVLRASQRAKSLVQQILAFSRKAGVNKQRVDLVQVVMEASRFLRALLPPTIDFEINVGSAEAIIYGDAGQLHQVVMNLGTNAAQSLGEATGHLQMSIETREINSWQGTGVILKPGSYCIFKISDDGCGMSEEIQQKIFEPFFSTKDVGKGTGLGLSVVHGIVKAHGGDVCVTSQQGEGSTFSVYLPLSTERLGEQVLINADPNRVQLDGEILFVDDELALTNLWKRQLENAGARVTATTSPKEALNLFREDPQAFDLVITDQMMPGMVGTALLAEVLAIKPEQNVLVCTGHAGSLNRDKALSLGARDLVQKPYDRGEFLAIIAAFLNPKNDSV